MFYLKKILKNHGLFEIEFLEFWGYFLLGVDLNICFKLLKC